MCSVQVHVMQQCVDKVTTSVWLCTSSLRLLHCYMQCRADCRRSAPVDTDVQRTVHAAKDKRILTKGHSTSSVGPEHGDPSSR